MHLRPVPPSPAIRVVYVLHAHEACSYVPARLWIISYKKVGVGSCDVYANKGVGIMTRRGPTMRTCNRSTAVERRMDLAGTDI